MLPLVEIFQFNFNLKKMKKDHVTLYLTNHRTKFTMKSHF